MRKVGEGGVSSAMEGQGKYDLLVNLRLILCSNGVHNDVIVIVGKILLNERGMGVAIV